MKILNPLMTTGLCLSQRKNISDFYAISMVDTAISKVSLYKIGLN